MRAYWVAAAPMSPRAPSSHAAYGATNTSATAVTTPQPAATV